MAGLQLRSNGLRAAGVALGVVICLWLGLTKVYPNALAQTDPEKALKLNSGHAAALVHRAELRVDNDNAAVSSPGVAADARAALLRDPLNAGAVRLIAMGSESKPQFMMKAARFGYRLSRRDFFTTLILVNHAANNSSIAETLGYYDAALRTYDQAPAVMFPRLVSASEDPEIVTELAKSLATNPAWREPALIEIINGSPPDRLLQLRTELARLKAPFLPGSDKQLMNRLSREGRNRQAFGIYHSLMRGSKFKSALLRHGDFETGGDLFPFEWSIPELDGSYAEIGPRTPGQPDKALWVFMAKGKAQEVARQTMMLTPGSYVLTGKVGVDLEAPKGMPAFEIYCATQPSQHLAIPAPPDEGTAPFSVGFSVSSACDGVALLLRTPQTVEADGEIWVDDLVITQRRADAVDADSAPAAKPITAAANREKPKPENRKANSESGNE